MSHLRVVQALPGCPEGVNGISPSPAQAGGSLGAVVCLSALACKEM